jgi:hypothetical protein
MDATNVFSPIAARIESSPSSDVESFRYEVRGLLRHVCHLIPEELMSPCVRQSLGNLALITRLQGEVPASVIRRAIQMAAAAPPSA